jgi:N-acetylglucosaminyl-diphospho-decaprenol L-rhamnosyltransferase
VPPALDVEVLVVSYGSADVLAACFAAVEQAAPGTPIGVREHSSDAVAIERLTALADAHPAPVRVEHDPSNPGFGSGCNALARGSSATHLLFLNPDAELVCWPWDEHDPPPTAAIVGPRMIESGPPGAHAGVRYGVRDEIARSWLRRTGPLPDGRGFVSGAALLIDRASFERVGGFDERYFLFYEDIDLCLRANELGVVTRIEPRWMVRHAGAHSTRPRFGRSLAWSYESALRFHGDRRQPLGLYRAYVATDAVLRMALRALRGDRIGAAAYRDLATRAASDTAATLRARLRRSR